MRIKKNGKVINLSESDLRRIVKRVLSEQEETRSIGELSDYLDRGSKMLGKLNGTVNLYRTPEEKQIQFQGNIGNVVNWGNIKFWYDNVMDIDVNKNHKFNDLLYTDSEFDFEDFEYFCAQKPFSNLGYSVLIGNVSGNNYFKGGEKLFYVQPPNNGEAYLYMTPGNSPSHRTRVTKLYNEKLLNDLSDVLLPFFKEIENLTCKKPEADWSYQDNNDDNKSQLG